MHSPFVSATANFKYKFSYMRAVIMILPWGDRNVSFAYLRLIPSVNCLVPTLANVAANVSAAKLPSGFRALA